MDVAEDKEPTKDIGTASRRQSSSGKKDRKDYRTRASESPPPRPNTKKEKSRSDSPSPDRKKGPLTSKVDLSSSDSSQENKEGKEPVPKEHQSRRPSSRPPRSKSPALYKEMEKDQLFRKAEPRYQEDKGHDPTNRTYAKKCTQPPTHRLPGRRPSPRAL